MEELNKNTPEEENTSETTEVSETAEVVEEAAEAAEIPETEEIPEVPETEEDSEAVPVEALNTENQSRPAGMLRSAITAVIVLALFAAVYFIYTAFNPEEKKTTQQPSEPKTEMSISEETGIVEPESPDADKPDKSEKVETSEKPETKPENNVQVMTEEEPSPEYTAASNKITAEARKKYGENVMVLPEYNNQLKTVKIGDAEHKCYLAAAVKLDPTQESGTQIIHALYDTESGKILFDDTDTWEVLD